MKKIIHIAILIVVIVSLGSCVKEVKLDYNYESKLVLYSFVSDSDSLIKVSLVNNQFPNSNIAFFDDKTISYVKDAKIVVRDELNNTIDLLYDDVKHYYYTDSNSFKFIADRNYSIQVKSSDGREANSVMKMPRPVYPENISCDTSTKLYSVFNQTTMMYETKRDISLKMEIKGKGDYYHCYAIVFYSKKYPILSKVSDFEKVFFENDEVPILLNEKRFYDVSVSVVEHSSIPNNLEFITIDSVEFYVMAANEDYFKYTKSRKLQYSSLNDPFAEPVLIHTNVEFGLGVFTGFTVRSKKIIF